MSDLFKCSSCGSCCKRVSNIIDFPEPIKKDGSCSHLTDDNLCGIYNERPLICRVDKYYDVFLKEKMSRSEWNSVNTKSCNIMMDQDNLPEDKRLKENE
jgi:Fe-S-cluster containining protein|tara:strand:- start:784 stop:1080 length:297 start_codon:yes stop_codon:yes gene_type:complete